MDYKVIGALGDSITNGFWDEEGTGWFIRLGQKLLRNAPYQYILRNMSKGGDRIPDIYHRLASEALTKEIDILLIAVGTNDLIRTPELSSPLDLSPHLRQDYWQKTLELARKNISQIVVLDILPICEKKMPFIQNETSYFLTNKDVEAYNLQIADLCHQQNIPFLKRYDLWKNRNLETLYQDSVHPLTEAHQLIADQVLDQLQQLHIL